MELKERAYAKDGLYCERVENYRGFFTYFSPSVYWVISQELAGTFYGEVYRVGFVSVYSLDWWVRYGVLKVIYVGVSFDWYAFLEGLREKFEGGEGILLSKGMCRGGLGWSIASFFGSKFLFLGFVRRWLYGVGGLVFVEAVAVRAVSF